MQQPRDQSVDQRIAESHLPGQHLDIALVCRQYLDIAMAVGNITYSGLWSTQESVATCYILIKSYVNGRFRGGLGTIAPPSLQPQGI